MPDSITTAQKQWERVKLATFTPFLSLSLSLFRSPLFTYEQWSLEWDNVNSIIIPLTVIILQSIHLSTVPFIPWSSLFLGCSRRKWVPYSSYLSYQLFHLSRIVPHYCEKRRKKKGEEVTATGGWLTRDYRRAFPSLSLFPFPPMSHVNTKTINSFS